MPEDGRPIPPIVVKKYANRRLYDTESSIYITLDTLADMVRHGRDFVVYDAKTGDDITRSVLTQIIMEEEIRGRNMLPTAFLRQLIGFYGDSRQGQVPGYLEHVMEQFIAQQHQAPTSVPRVLPAFLRPEPMHKPEPEAAGHHEVAVMDQAISLFSPVYRPGQDPDGLLTDMVVERPHVQAGNGHSMPNSGNGHSIPDSGNGHSTQDTDDVAALRQEIARLRHALAQATDNRSEPAGLLQTAGGGIRH